MFQGQLFLGGVGFGSMTILILAATRSPGQEKIRLSADVAKGAVIEKPAEIILAKTSGATPAAANFANPRVEPGLVKWHPSFAAACEAAKKSGKPVLLFQMMGKLDDQFC
jgi:hypothetical protein